MQVIGDPDGVEPQTEHLRVFGFLERELRQIHLVAQASLGPHRGHEGLDVLSHPFLAGNEYGAEAGSDVAFAIRERLPVRAVAGEVDVGGIPEFRVASGE